MYCGRKPHTKLCDFPQRSRPKVKPGAEARERPIKRCSKRLCDRCAAVLGANLELCPAHAELVEQHGLGAKLADLLAQDDRKSRDVACDLIEQAVESVGTSIKDAVTSQQAFKPRDYADWREFVGERAAIFEYDGGFPRDVAERKAMALAGERPK